MRILPCLLALVAAPAWAEWVMVDKNDEATFYIDPATIRKDGNLRRVWELQNLKQHDNGVISWRALKEYDCKEERSRTLTASIHSEPMAGGKVLHMNDAASPWSYIAPGTFSAIYLKHACAK